MVLILDGNPEDVAHSWRKINENRSNISTMAPIHGILLLNGNLEDFTHAWRKIGLFG